MRRADRAMMPYELAGYFRGNLPYRFVPLIPLAVFLAAWTWRVASPFAAVAWIVFIGLEPRINNAFFGSPRELDALSLFPADWRRIVLIKNVSVLMIGACALALVSVVSLNFSPGPSPPASWRISSSIFRQSASPSSRSETPRPRGTPAGTRGRSAGGLAEAVWMSLTLLAASVPYFIITELVEIPWLCHAVLRGDGGDLVFQVGAGDRSPHHEPEQRIMAEDGNVIEFLNVGKRYADGPPVLDGLTLAVGPGRVFGFIGLNGAGKTTTIRIMSGLTPADSGETRLFGERWCPAPTPSRPASVTCSTSRCISNG